MGLIEFAIEMLESGETPSSLSPSQVLGALKIFQQIQESGIFSHINDELEQMSDESIFEKAGVNDSDIQEIISTSLDLVKSKKDARNSEGVQQFGISSELLK